MIVYLVGVPGAGKTYFAVDKIFTYVRDKKYQSIYTNINQFNFNFGGGIVKSFIWDDFYKNISDLYFIYKDKNTADDDLIEKVKEFGYYKSIIIIDECHNYLDTLDPVVTWIFSYHRHLFIDFLLITQNLALVDSKYKKFAEYFIRAVPTTLKLFNNSFTYKKFIDSRLSQKSFAGKENIKKSQEIFDLYQSGDHIKSKSVIKKYLMLFFVGCIIVFFIFKFVISNMKGDSKDVKQGKNVSVAYKNIVRNSDDNFKNDISKQVTSLTFLRINCFNNDCFYKNNYIPLNVIKLIIQNTDSQLINIRVTNKNSVVLFLLVTQDFINSFRSVGDEKQQNFKTFDNKSAFDKSSRLLQ